MSTLDAARPARDGASRELVGGRTLTPKDIVPMVENVLRAAMGRLDAEAAEAHAEASLVIAAAARRSTDLVLAYAVGSAAAATEPPASVPGPLAMELPEPGLDVLGPEVAVRNAAQVFELFWADIPVEEPIGERLRRWAQRPPQ